MQTIAFSLLLTLMQTTYAADKTEMGILSLATEAGWGASFELKSDGSADVVPAFDGEKEDGSTNLTPKTKHLKASWKAVRGGIEIAYLRHRDRFRFEKECKDWEDHPCFRYEKSVEGSEDKSLLKFEKPYINWAWKNQTKPKTTKRPDLTHCKTDCEEMHRTGALKKGITIEQCVQTTCK